VSIIVVGIAIVATILLVLHFSRLRGGSSFSFFLDFNAFYCGGQVVALRADPYHVQPLLDCEDKYPRLEAARGIAIPAPLPGYDFVPLAMISRLPYETARFCALGVMLVSCVVLVVAAAGIARCSVWAVAAMLAPILYNSINIGQSPPILAASMIALAAFLMARRYYVWAAVACCAAMCEPHMALPSYLAALIWVPRCRLPLVAGGLTLALLSVAAIGLPANLEYFDRVLPTHSLIEVHHPDQYSLTWILGYFGVPDQLAVLLGTLSYVAMLAVGLLIARRYAARFGTPEAYVLLPAVSAMLAGPFVHLFQIGGAIPGCLWLVNRWRASTPSVVVILIVLAMPWIAMTDWHFVGAKFLGFLSWMIVLALFAAWELAPQWRDRHAAIKFAAVTAALIALLGAGIHAIPTRVVPPLASAGPRKLQESALASSSYAAFVAKMSRQNSDQTFWAKVPTWLALSFFVALPLCVTYQQKLADFRDADLDHSRPQGLW